MTEIENFPAPLANADWLARHLGETGLRILDCSVVTQHYEDGSYSFACGREEWAKSHIPGSIHVDVLEELSELFIERGVPEHIRSDNGSEFTSDTLREWLRNLGVKTLFIEPGSPWENGYIESFNGKLRDGLLNGELFDTVMEARILTERWRKEYNTIRPHSSLGGRPPAPETHYPRLVANA